MAGISINTLIRYAEDALPGMTVKHMRHHPYDEHRFVCTYENRTFNFALDSVTIDNAKVFEDMLADRLLQAITYFEAYKKGKVKETRIYKKEDYDKVTGFGLF